MPRWPWVRRSVGEQRLRAWMPYRVGNRDWLRDTLGQRVRPEWDRQAKCWTIARPHLHVLVDALADRFGAVDVYLEFNRLQQCDTRCQEATGDDCLCSCLGENHGGGVWRGWRLVGDTTLIKADRARRHLRVVR